MGDARTSRLARSIRRYLRRRKADLRRTLSEEEARREIERLVRRFHAGR